MSKKKTFGKEFEEPWCQFDDLIDENIWDSGAAMFSLILSSIPFYGLAGILVSLWVVYGNEFDNKFGMEEQAWKVLVYATLIQMSYSITYLAFY